MPGWLTELLKALGVATPVIYAAATYGFFHWLDKKASGPAKKAISGWLDPKEYDRAAVAAAIVEIFDRVYTRPLRARPAFLRSASITVLTSSVILYEFAWLPVNIVLIHNQIALLVYICGTIISDYIALFIIRRLLTNVLSPMISAFLGPIIGIVIFFIGFALALMMSVILYSLFASLAYLYNNLEWPPMYPPISTDISDATSKVFLSTLLSGLVVHLWLPFFALSVVLAKGLTYFLLATKQVQWFIKQGQQHPLDALGLVATPLVFLGAVVVQWLVSK